MMVVFRDRARDVAQNGGTWALLPFSLDFCRDLWDPLDILHSSVDERTTSTKSSTVASSGCFRMPVNCCVLPEQRVTLHSGRIGDTSPPREEGACLGRSVTWWMNGCGLLPACSTARRWPACARSSGSPVRRATRFTSATKVAASRG